MERRNTWNQDSLYVYACMWHELCLGTVEKHASSQAVPDDGLSILLCRNG